MKDIFLKLLRLIIPRLRVYAGLFDFLKRPDLIMSFKMAPVDEWSFAKELPTKKQIRKGFEGLEDLRAKQFICSLLLPAFAKEKLLL